jgi:chromosome segregation ATPase
MRERENELEEQGGIIVNHVKTESENLEKIRLLTTEVRDKDEILQSALAQVDSDITTKKNDGRLKEKYLKIARYGSYISKLLEEIKALKAKQYSTTPSDAPVNDIITKLSRENGDLNTKVKKVSDELKSGKNALKKVEDNIITLAKSIRDLQDQLNVEKNKSSKIEVEKKRLERKDILEIKDRDRREKTPVKKIKEEKCRFFEENGWCKFGKLCHNFHPTKYCEW